MPTGYTASIEDGKVTTGKDFLKICARAFGACVEMRDEPLSKSIPEKFEIDDYHLKRFEESEKELVHFLTLTDKEIQKNIDISHEKTRNEAITSLKRDSEIHNRYIKVLAEVNEWEPPTSEHENLKKFAIEQITMCLSYVDGRYQRERIEREKITLDEYKKIHIEHLEKSIKYHKEEYQKEIERTESRNKWLSDLRNSLA